MWENPHYADGAYAIIGRALESLVGMSYEDYVTQHIFKPLGIISNLTNSTTTSCCPFSRRSCGCNRNG